MEQNKEQTLEKNKLNELGCDLDDDMPEYNLPETISAEPTGQGECCKLSNGEKELLLTSGTINAQGLFNMAIQSLHFPEVREFFKLDNQTKQSPPGVS